MTVQIHDSSDLDTSIRLTESALKHFKKQLCGQDNALGIRLSTKKAGCSGLKYVIDFVTEPDATDFSYEIEQNFSVFVSRASFPHLKGSTIDYVKEGLNGHMRIHNPNEKGSCGCGESFSTDVEI